MRESMLYPEMSLEMTFMIAHMLELAFAGAVFGDVGQPQRIWYWGGENPTDQTLIISNITPT
jgi:hypothetical protein